MPMLFPLWLFCFVTTASSYKILVYSAQFSHSHLSFMGHIADTLVEAGHDVVVYVPEFRVNETGVKLARTIINPRTFALEADSENDIRWQKSEVNPAQMLKSVKRMIYSMLQLCKPQLENVEMIERLRKENFELGIGEIYDSCAVAYFNKIGLQKYITTFSTAMFNTFLEPFGIESNPSYVPAIFAPFSDEMTYKQRAINLAISAATKMSNLLIRKPLSDAFFREHVEADYNIDEQTAKSSFVFVNSEEFLDFPRLITHKIVYVGGIGIKNPQKLPEEFAEILDNAAGGVILVSFGSITKSSAMPADAKAAFLRTFQHFPEVTFIWKYEVDDDVGKDTPNLVKVKWTPQNDLLGHPNLKTFISHGGLNSLMECAHAGVPVILIPLAGDQMRNAKMMEKRNVAYLVDKHNITETALITAINAVLKTERYRNSAIRLQAMIKKKPESAAERVVKYAEFAAEFGHIENFDLASTKLTFFEYYLLDILIPFVLIAAMIFLILIQLSLIMWRKILFREKRKTE